MRLSRTVLAACAIAALASSAACVKDSAAEATAASAEAAHASAALLKDRPHFGGGDANAWLTARGDLADSGYCRARLVLPLPRKPDWVVEYSPAEFSRQMPNALVHYDGQLLVTATSSQVMGIDVESGTINFNSDLYQHYDRDVPREEFRNLFASPNGFLVGSDDQGRYYCWDVLSPELRELWVSETSQPTSGYVATDDAVYTSFLRDVRRLDLTTGEPVWEVPTLDRDSGIVMGDEGTVIWWSWLAGKAIAFSAEDGRQMWRFAGPNIINRIIIDNAKAQCYFFLESEEVQCRDLATGDMKWTFSWAGLMDEKQREYYKKKQKNDAFYFPVAQASVLPDGLALSLMSGQVYRLDDSGNLIWSYQSEGAIHTILAFENGLIVCEFYTAEAYSPWSPWYQLFSREPPDWNELAALKDDDTASEDGGVKVGDGRTKFEFGRTLVLSLDTGEVLDTFEPDLFPYTYLVPAGNKVVYGEILAAYVYRGPHDNDAPRRILAYPWLEQGGD